MWLPGTVLIGLGLLFVTGQNLDEEEGLRCYDCNSFNPHCRDQVNQSDPNQGFAVFTRCPITQRCFIRKDKDGVIVRGCADGWRFSLIDIEYMGCKEQSVDWLGPQVWCFCDEDLCNQVPMAQLNRGQYSGMAQSSEHFSVDSDLDVEHELTGWLGPELLEKHIAEENEKNTSSTEKTTATTTPVTTTTATNTKSTATTTISKSTSALPTTKITKVTNQTIDLTNSTTWIVTNGTTDGFNATNTTMKLDTNSTSTTIPTNDTSTKLTTDTISKSKNTTSATKSISKTTSKVTFHSTFKAHVQSNSTKSDNKTTTKDNSNRKKSIYTTATTRTTTTNETVDIDPSNGRKSTQALNKVDHVDLPWWIWHVVSSTAKPTTTTTAAHTTISSTTTKKSRPTTRRSYLKPKVVLVTQRPNGRRENTALNEAGTTPSSESERWTWSPSWWDKWWRPGTRRPRKPKRPSMIKKQTRRPSPTQGKGHYWWLAPVGPTVRPKKHRMPSTKLMKLPTTNSKWSYTTMTKNPKTTTKQNPSTKLSTTQPPSTTMKTTKQTTKAKVTYPQHLIGASTPAPTREYPHYPKWGRRLVNKSIYPVRTPKRRLPSTRSTKRQKLVQITTHKIKMLPTRPTPTTVKVTTRRRRPTTLSKQRRLLERKDRYRPKTQQKDSEPFFCWDCYSASSNCRDVVNSPYTYYVGRTPCPFTRKCFVRKDDGVIYRGCADGWTSSLIDSNYNGCKVQYTWGRPVEWCFCDSTLCNGNSLKYIKEQYPNKNKENTIRTRGRDGERRSRSRDKTLDRTNPR